MAAKSTGTDILDMEQNYFNLTLSSDYQVCTRVFFCNLGLLSTDM